MSLVHLIVDNEEFDVSRTTLEKAHFFRGLLEIESDNIKVENVSPVLFKTLITILEMKDNSANDLAILYEYLGFEEKCELLSNYKCKIVNCGGKRFNYHYCVDHKCIENQCLYGNKACTNHK